ncbi:MAG: DUF2752 domain-containing protein [Actinobacteria bacterium]|nr:DUF2752 domain-containing protein [Actinomycetota bacterium]
MAIESGSAELLAAPGPALTNQGATNTVASFHRPTSRLVTMFGEATGIRMLVGGVVAAGTTAALLGGTDDGVTLCPYRRYTGGGYCPACGGTRAISMMVRGDVAGAIVQHPVAAFIAIQVLVLAVGVMWAPLTFGRWVRARGERIAVANGLLLLAVWPVRLALGQIPLPFA